MIPNHAVAALSSQRAASNGARAAQASAFLRVVLAVQSAATRSLGSRNRLGKNNVPLLILPFRTPEPRDR
jgi:hypothetical protein